MHILIIRGVLLLVRLGLPVVLSKLRLFVLFGLFMPCALSSSLTFASLRPLFNSFSTVFLLFILNHNDIFLLSVLGLLSSLILLFRNLILLFLGLLLSLFFILSWLGLVS
jgi:hypothetical protein